jgi:hypothetical protein
MEKGREKKNTGAGSRDQLGTGQNRSRTVGESSLGSEQGRPSGPAHQLATVPLRPAPAFSESDGPPSRLSGGRGTHRAPRLALASLLPFPPSAEDDRTVVDRSRRGPPFAVMEEGSGSGGHGRHGLG